MKRVALAAGLVIVAVVAMAAGKPVDDVTIFPGVDLVINDPYQPGMKANYIWIVNDTGEPMVRIYDQGGCVQVPGCVLFSGGGKPFALGVIQVDDPTDGAVGVEISYEKDFKWCDSCRKHNRWVYRLIRVEE